MASTELVPFGLLTEPQDSLSIFLKIKAGFPYLLHIIEATEPAKVNFHAGSPSKITALSDFWEILLSTS